MMPAPAHDAARPTSPRSTTATRDAHARQVPGRRQADDAAAEDQHVERIAHGVILWAFAQRGIAARTRKLAEGFQFAPDWYTIRTIPFPVRGVQQVRPAFEAPTWRPFRPRRRVRR